MPVTKEDADKEIAAFLTEFKGISSLRIIHAPTQEDFYGKQASFADVGIIKGAFLPKDRQLHLPLASLRDTRDMRETLLHEAVGHYGTLTFTENQKRNLLTAIAESREHLSLKADWEFVDKEYAEKSDIWKAEEVFCLAAERISDKPSMTGAETSKLWEEVIAQKTRPLEREDLQAIANAIADGLRRGTREQQIFPQDNNSLFKTEEKIMANDNDLRTRLRDEPSVSPEDTRAELREELATAALRDRVRGQEGISPEDTRSELLEHEQRKEAEARASAEKEERKMREAEAMRREREAQARGLNEDQAKERAAHDAAAHEALQALGNRGQGEAYYLRVDMAERAQFNEAYSKALKEAAPDLHTRILEIEKENTSVDLRAFHAKNAEVTPEKHQAASDHVAAFMATGRDDIAARATIATAMQERGEADPGYVNALRRITPDLSTLAEEHKPELREEHYRFAVAARADQERNNPEANEDRQSFTGEQRLTEAQMKVVNAEAVRYAAQQGEIPSQANLNVEPRDAEFDALLKAQERAIWERERPESSNAQYRPDDSTARNTYREAEMGAKEYRDDPEQAGANRAVNAGLAAQREMEESRRAAKELRGLNSAEVSQKTGKELDRGEIIMPRRITQAYTEVDGKFYAKDSNRVMFEDKGEKLATSTTDKRAIEDMVALAKAKQWENLKLSGSQEFRREAWLQAESQGIKTQGYTPKQADLAALETLRQQRATNAITPLQERKTSERTNGHEAIAPRHDLNKNQAAMHVEASKFIAGNIQALQKQPGMADKSVEDLTKLAYWRGIVAEENKLQPRPVQDEALARFDKQAQDPQFLKRLNQETEPKIQDKTTERVQRRETHEQSL